MAICIRCKSKALVSDNVTGGTVCSSCGVVQAFDDFQHAFGGVSGPEGTYVRLGTSGSGTQCSYSERKLYLSNQILEDITFRLGFSDVRTRDVKSMVKEVTNGEFGVGNWFSVLVGACCYIVMRQNDKVLSISDVVGVIGCELYEMGKMVNRVVDFLGIELKEFDLVGYLEKSIRGFTGFTGFDKEKVDFMVMQGNFVIQCCIKWFLTTGRRPGPVVVAVLVFVGEVNGVEVRLEDVAKELNVAVRTCKLRYKELLEAMVEVAQRLPWGKDVNVKNVVKNSHLLLKYMEMKSMETSKHCVGNNFLEVKGGFELRNAIEECLCKEVGHGGIDGSDCAVASGLDIVDGVQGLENYKISDEELAKIYSKFKIEFTSRKLLNDNESISYRDRLSGLDVGLFDEWWSGRSKMCERLLIMHLLEEDIGLDALPPSYIQSCQAVERRREKIRRAKMRINSIMNPSTDISTNTVMQTSLDVQSFDSANLCTAETVNGSKKRKKQCDTIDWEDFIIEALLLHRVKEEEIEKGHYNALLGLHVFRSGLI